MSWNGSLSSWRHRVDGRIRTSDELPYFIQAIGLLRQKAGRPWPAALSVLAKLLDNYKELEDQSVWPLLLTSVGILGNDGPIRLQPVRELLQSRGMVVQPQARMAAANVLGELFDANSVAVLKEVASGPKNERRLRIAALEALGKLGGFLRRGGKDVGVLADYLEGVLLRRGEDADRQLVTASLKAFGEVVDPSRVKVVFELMTIEVYCFPGMAVAQTHDTIRRRLQGRHSGLY